MTLFWIGLVGLIGAVFLYKNERLLPHNAWLKIYRNDPILFGGVVALMGVLMLGIVGYWNWVESAPLKLTRQGLLLIIVTLTCTYSPAIARWHSQSSWPWVKYVTTTHILQGVGIYVVGSLFIKCLIQIDGNGDTWMYHLPFAARLWGLVGVEHYLMDADRELAFISFPKLANYLQGLLWAIGGLTRPQLANLVSFASLILLLGFARYSLAIPLYQSAIALLAIPLVHIAATACYVDLFGNVGVTIMIFCTYKLYLDRKFFNVPHSLWFILGGILAANTKFLLVPITAVFWGLAVLRVLQYHITLKPLRIIERLNLTRFLILLFPATVIIFATEMWNVIAYKNPFYPLKVSIFGWVLNHASVPSSDYMSAKLQAMPALQRWIFSLLEIGAFDDRRPWLWSIAMDFVPLDSDTFGLGGYFAIYVIFNIAVLIALGFRNTPETRWAIALMVILSILTPLMPFAYQLRYYLYWMMVLVLINLFLLHQPDPNPSKFFPIITPRHYSLVATFILFLFITLTRWDFTSPRSRFLATYLEQNTDPALVETLETGKAYCLVNFSPHTFLYVSPFHPPKDYSIKGEFNISPEYVKENCQGRIIKTASF